MGYLGNFIIYTMAMVGVIVVALLIFKFTTSGNNLCKKSKYLRVIDSMSLGQRKNLYIVSTGKEQFLLASDVDKTNLISKLESISDNQDYATKTTLTETNKNYKNLNNSDEKVGIWTSMLDKINK